ncbi:MAG: hypothetical protein R6U28_01245 [Cyclonatronaceae bacterium]
MASHKELSERNFRRISWINILLTPPLLLLFAWPYAILGLWFEFPEFWLYTGAFLFAFPLSLTIIHGHVTLALGALQRSHYYEWLTRRRWGFGFWIKPAFFATRFRLIPLIISLFMLLAGAVF